MRCDYVPLPNGQFAIACSSGRKRPRPCSKCGRPSSKLCDWKKPYPNGERPSTCDAPICVDCGTHVGPDRDLCPAHALEWGSRLALFYAGTLQDPQDGGYLFVGPEGKKLADQIKNEPPSPAAEENTR